MTSWPLCTSFAMIGTSQSIACQTLNQKLNMMSCRATVFQLQEWRRDKYGRSFGVASFFSCGVCTLLLESWTSATFDVQMDPKCQRALVQKRRICLFWKEDNLYMGTEMGYHTNQYTIYEQIMALITKKTYICKSRY